MPDDSEQGRGQGDGGRPDYKVYKSRPRLLDRVRSTDVSSLRDRVRRPGSGRSRPAAAGKQRRPWWRWVLYAAGAWLLISALAFAVSSQLQKWKLADSAGDALEATIPLMAVDPQTILVIGTDARAAGTLDGSETSEKCIEAGANGEAPPSGCAGFRADTLMLVRAGGGKFNKLSIPRDSFAEIPGQSSQKINAAYAFGGAALQIETVEGFMDTDIDHVVIVDFEGFEEFIDAIGGVEVDLPGKVCSEISGGEAAGGFSLELDAGEHTLSGEEALVLARTRTNLCNPAENDIDRALRQQLILSGIKGRLTSPLRLPYNFIKGPWIGWTAPKAIVSDMGALTMPQLVFAAIIGGDSGTEILEPEGTNSDGSLIVTDQERQAALDNLLDG
jgi:LCP family protein required for cell wall assembly